MLVIGWHAMLDDPNLSAVIESFEAGRRAGLTLDHEIVGTPVAIIRPIASYWEDGFAVGLSERKASQVPIGSSCICCSDVFKHERQYSDSIVPYNAQR